MKTRKLLRIIISLLLITVSIVLVIGLVLYVKDSEQILNIKIPDNIIGAKELVELAKPYVDKYWGNRNYLVGAIVMYLDEKHEGKVEIWYKDENRNKNGVPNIITVEIDTKEKIITRIRNKERNSKIEPGEINISSWNIDSSELFDIAKRNFEDLEDFDETLIFISGDSEYSGGIETWNISFYSIRNQKEYYLKVDPYTGEIYRKESK